MLNGVLDFIFQFDKNFMWLIYAILVACGLGLPIPEDIAIIAAGIMTTDGAIHFYQAFLVCLLGVLTGDSMIYWIGRTCGEQFFKNRVTAMIITPTLHQAAAIAFDKHGDKIIFFARFMPGIRAPIYFFMGSIKKSFWLFLAIDAFAASISVPLWIVVGNLVGENIPVLEKVIKNMKIGTLILMVFFLLIFFSGIYLKKAMMKYLFKQ